MLVLDEVHSHYGPSHIVQGISLRAAPGEVIAIFGRNGVGKTTLLKTVAGWISPSAGDISMNGERIGGAPPDRIARLGIGFIPEDRRIFPDLTVDENLRLGLLAARRRRGAASQAALTAAYACFPQLQERRRQAGATLSGGEQQMLAMARVMVGEPKLLLVDEPSEGLAPMIVQTIYAMLADMKRSGRAMLLVEQNVTQALGLCDRFVAIERGRIVLAGDPKLKTDCDKLFSIISV
jgi:branched-chain amino acid transport system ATP-binding protein